jgi:hypothetical protein
LNIIEPGYALCRDNRNVRFVVFSLAEFNSTGNQREERMVFSDAYVETGIVTGAALTHEDVTGDASLTTV